MKKMMYILTRGKALIMGMMLTGAMLLGTESVQAQQAAGGTINPEAHLAQRLGVVPYSFGTFDRANAMVVLEDIRKDLRPLMQHNPSYAVRLKFEYADRMLIDLKNHIAPEITLLTSLHESITVLAKSTPGQASESQMTALYNEIVSLMQ